MIIKMIQGNKYKKGVNYSNKDKVQYEGNGLLLWVSLYGRKLMGLVMVYILGCHRCYLVDGVNSI